jgi:hypothetical protein
MIQRLVLFSLILLVIVGVNVWHYAAYYFVDTFGIIPGLVLLAAMILLAFKLDPY